MKRMTKAELLNHNRKADMYHDIFEILRTISGFAALIFLYVTVSAVEADENLLIPLIISFVIMVVFGVSCYCCKVYEDETIQVQIKKGNK